MPGLSAFAKPFSPESDSYIFSLTQKFIFLERLQIPAMQSKHSASLLIQLQTSFNLLFEEQMVYLSASDMFNSPVTECISPSSVASYNIKPADKIYSSDQKFLTPRKKKKQERGAKWKLTKLSENSIKPQPQIAPTNSDCVSKKSSISNPISDLVSKSNINSFQSSHSNSLSNTKSTVDVPPISPPTTVVESNSSVTIRCVSSSTSSCLSRRSPNAPVSITIPKVHSANLSNTFL